MSFVRLRRLFNVKNNTEWILNVASRDSRVFFYYCAACGEQPAFCCLHIRHKKIKDRSRPISLFDVKTKCTGFKADQIWSALGYGKSQCFFVELSRFSQMIGLNN